MIGPQQRYTRELYERFGYLGSWTPGTPHALGDVGVVTGNVFSRLSSLNSLQIGFDIRPDRSEEVLWHASESGVTTMFKAAGAAAPAGTSLPTAKAGVAIEFKAGGGVVFVARGCRTTSIEDQIALGDILVSRYRAGAWELDRAVVTELVSAESITVLVSESSGGRVELVAEANAELNTWNLADASAGLTINASSSMHTQIVAQGAVTPLLRVRRIQRRLLGRPKLRMREGSPADAGEFNFVEFEPEFE